MSYLLDGSTIRAPHSMQESNSTMMAQHRTLDGSVSRDYFGDNKRMWNLSYNSTKKTDFDTINTIYQAYLDDELPVTWQVTETNYTISEVSVHIDLQVRDFNVKGTDYISSFELVLTEA